MDQWINFTKRNLDNLPLPEKDRTTYRDTKVDSLQIRVSATGTKTFCVFRRIAGGKPVRVTLGKYPYLTIEQARRMALDAISKMAAGADPIREKKAAKVRGVTLAEVFQDYLKARKSLKPGTVHDYKQIMRHSLPDWGGRPLSEITRDMVAKRHTDIGKRSPARANNTMRVLRALFNFAAGEYEDEDGNPLFPDNPVTRISHTRAWYRVERRQTYIKPHDLKVWLEAVMSLDNHNARDYFRLILFTGLRRSEAAKLEWCDVDLTNRTFTIRDTKNRVPHILPLTDYLYDMIARREPSAINDFVFPGSGTAGHIIDVRSQIQNVIEQSGISFILHDLRRTFCTIAESLDIPAYALKRLLNHKMTGDVTAGYIISDVERLRKPMQQITDFILKAAGVKKTATVTNIEKQL